MEAVALAGPQTIKISSKRQITIPSKWYREMEFGEYALATWTEDGIQDATQDRLRPPRH